MSDTKSQNKGNLYKTIKLLSNRKKFQILELTQNEKKNITELSKELNLAYNKCSDYVRELEKEKLILKVKEGKVVYVTSKIKLSNSELVLKDK